MPLHTLKKLLTERAVWWIFALAVVTRLFGFTSPWGEKDHYNFGGPYMSGFVFCVTHSTWDETRWRIHTGCPEENDIAQSPLFHFLNSDQRAKAVSLPLPSPSKIERSYYLNHPPLYPWLLSASSLTFGEHEWSFRLVTLLFSLANVILVGLIVLRATGSRASAILSCLLQAGFLGPIYFGTHVDYPNEANGTFFLLAVYAAISERWLSAYAVTFIGALIDWPSLMMVPALAALSLIRRRGRVISAAAVVFTPILVFAIAAFIVGPSEVIELFRIRIFHAPYGQKIVTLTDTLAFPFHLVATMITHYIRLLGPLFFAAGVLILIQAARDSSNFLTRTLKDLRERNDSAALFLLAVATVFIIAIGPRYVMAHPFWLIPTLSVWAILIASRIKGLKPNRGLDIFIVLITTAFYPFGIYTSIAAIGMTANILIVATALVAIWFAYKRQPILSALTVSLAIAANMTAVINYRTEPPVDRDFCLQALRTYVETGAHVDLGFDPTHARQYYCRGIPRIK